MVEPKQRRTLLMFLFCATLLTLIGLVFIYSSSSIFALEQIGSSYYFLKKQLLGVIVGIVLINLIGRVPFSVLHQCAPLIWLGVAFITLIPIIMPAFATTIHGSTRWLSIGGYSFQPSEFLKVATLPFLARIMSHKDFAHRPFLKAMFPVMVCSAITIAILLIQPDFGQAVLIMATTLALFAISYSTLFYLGLAALPVILGAILLIIAKPYRLKRIATFLNPWDDPRGAGFQIIQSLIAIGSGGLFGVGIGQSHQKFFYLPMQHTDFIFSIIAEEAGFIGASFIIMIYLVLLYLGIKLAWHLHNPAALLTVFGIVVTISLQAIINLAVATGLAPTKGIGLPFISYGVSSLLAYSCMLGIVISCVRSEGRE